MDVNEKMMLHDILREVKNDPKFALVFHLPTAAKLNFLKDFPEFGMRLINARIKDVKAANKKLPRRRR